MLVVLSDLGNQVRRIRCLLASLVTNLGICCLPMSSYLLTRFRLARWRLQASQLWARYRAVACLDDQHVEYQRLSAFLESFRAFYAAADGEQSADTDDMLDRLYGDCTEILHELLDYIERCTDSTKRAAGEAQDVAATISPQNTNGDTLPNGGIFQGVGGPVSSPANLLELIPEALNAVEHILRDDR
jgi:hypothetical protein